MATSFHFNQHFWWSDSELSSHLVMCSATNLTIGLLALPKRTGRRGLLLNVQGGFSAAPPVPKLTIGGPDGVGFDFPDTLAAGSLPLTVFFSAEDSPASIEGEVWYYNFTASGFLCCITECWCTCDNPVPLY